MATKHDPKMLELRDETRRASQRFSDKIEYRRGRLDGRRGIPPASFAPQYIAGYAQGKRAAVQPPESDAEPSQPRARG